MANGWSSFFQTLLPKVGINLPEAISKAPIIYDPAVGEFVRTNGIVNLPAVIITIIITRFW